MEICFIETRFMERLLFTATSQTFGNPAATGSSIAAVAAYFLMSGRFLLPRLDANAGEFMPFDLSSKFRVSLLHRKRLLLKGNYSKAADQCQFGIRTPRTQVQMPLPGAVPVSRYRFMYCFKCRFKYRFMYRFMYWLYTVLCTNRQCQRLSLSINSSVITARSENTRIKSISRPQYPMIFSFVHS